MFDIFSGLRVTSCELRGVCFHSLFSILCSLLFALYSPTVAGFPLHFNLLFVPINAGRAYLTARRNHNKMKTTFRTSLCSKCFLINLLFRANYLHFCAAILLMFGFGTRNAVGTTVEQACFAISHRNDARRIDAA